MLPFRSLALALLFVSSAHAATHVWTGTAGDRFSDAANWVGGSPAGDADAELRFGPAAGSRSPVNDLANLTVRSLSVTDAGYRISGNAITLTSEVHIGGDAVLANELVLAGDVVFATDGNGRGARPFALEGAIRGNGRFIKRGPGVFVIGGRAPNTYSGETVIEQGSLRLAKGTNTIAVPGDLRLESEAEVHSIFTEQIADSSRVTLGANARLYHDGDETVGSVRTSGAGPRIGYFQVFWTAFAVRDGVIDASDGLTVNRLLLTGPLTVTVGVTRTFAALLVGDAPVTIRGGGRSFVEVESVMGSRVVIENAVNIGTSLPNANVVQRGGEFGGNAGSLRMEDGRLLPGTVTIARELVMTSGASLVINHDRDDPYVSAGGPVTLGGATLAIETPLGRRTAGAVIQLISNRSSAPVSGTFAGLPEGAIVQSSHVISYRGGAGNDVVLRSLPPIPTIELGALTFGAKVSMRVTVRSLGPVTGTVTVRHKGNVLATSTLVSGQTTVELDLPSGVYPLDFEYSGDASNAPATRTQEITVPAPTPVLTSVEPSVIPRGSGTATVILRGANFLPGARVQTDTQTFIAEYVSPAELRWEAPRSRAGQAARTEGIRVVQQPGSVASNSLTISWEAGATGAESRVTLNGNTLTVQVRPGATVAVMVGGALGNVTISGRAVFTDSDRDGRVSWQLTRTVATIIAAVIDVETGEHYVDGNFGFNSFPLDARVFRGPAADSNLRLAPGGPFQMLWVQPGARSALQTEVSDGVLHDADRNQDGVMFLTAGDFDPMNGSRPAGFRRGDILIALGIFGFSSYQVVLADEHFAPEAAGTLQLTPTGIRAYEEDGKAAVTILRPDGSSGRVTARLTSVDGTAKAGLDFERVDTTVTLEDGQMWTTIDVPLIDDALYAGEHELRLRLSDPSGAALGRSETVVILLEQERVPAISIASLSIDEGDGPRTVTTTISLAAPARVPLEVVWNMSGDLTGTIVFAPCQTRRDLEVPFTGNRVVDGDRSLAISAAVKNTAVSASGLIRITDDDVAHITARDFTVHETATSREIRVAFAIDTQVMRPVSVDYTTRDVTATAGGDYASRSGTVTSSGSSRELVIMIPLLGDDVAEPLETFEIDLSNPRGLVLGSPVARVTIVDDDTPLPVISIGDAEVHELGIMDFPVTLSAPTTSRVTVTVATTPGSASAQDYLAPSTTLSIEPGTIATVVRVSTTSDLVVEGPETFTVTLSNPTNATLGRAVATGTIVNRTEDLAVVAVNDVEVTEGNDGTRQVTVQLSLSRPDTAQVRVAWTTQDGTAIAGADYVAAQGEVVFTPLQTVRTITIALRGDTQPEANETFTVRLSLPSNARIVRGEGTVTILDDEGGGRRRAAGH
jgi:autotransporter-associated beta strand protein